MRKIVKYFALACAVTLALTACSKGARVNHTTPNIMKVLEDAGAACRILKPADYFDLFEREIGRFCAKLIEIYPPERVILLSTYPTNLCIRRDLSLDKIKDIAPDRRYMDEAIRVFTEKMGGCHVIKSLKYMMSSYNFKLSEFNPEIGGIQDFHYENNFNDYCWDCINVITDSFPADQEAEKLSELWEYYSAMFCPKCGSKKPEKLDKILCKHCGLEIPAQFVGLKFCPGCGKER